MLRLVGGLAAEERGVVRALAVAQRNKAEIVELLLAPVRDGDFGGALQGDIALVGLESVGRQTLHQAAAFHAADGGAPVVSENALVMRCARA